MLLSVTESFTAYKNINISISSFYMFPFFFDVDNKPQAANIS